LNAVYLKELDNTELILEKIKRGKAKFFPPVEPLAFRKEGRLEPDIQGTWVESLAVIVKTLQKYNTYMAGYKS
jgi:hypothetical protein